MNLAHMTIAEQLSELAQYHDRKRLDALGPGGRVTSDASYHAQLSDAAARASAHFAAMRPASARSGRP